MLLTLKDGKESLLKIPQTSKTDERAENAQQCVATLKMTMPTLLDRENNLVNSAYGAWPDRLYVIGMDGKIAYQGGPGPGGFRPLEVENWLRANMKGSDVECIRLAPASAPAGAKRNQSVHGTS